MREGENHRQVYSRHPAERDYEHPVTDQGETSYRRRPSDAEQENDNHRRLSYAGRDEDDDSQQGLLYTCLYK